MNKYLLAFLLLLPIPVFGEVKAVINAPEQVNIGDLVVLDSSASKGDNRLWIIDPKAEGRYLKIDQRVVFAIGTPGVYQFQLIVADKEANIDQVKHELTVGKPVPPPVVNPPPIDPPPIGNNKVRDAVKAATASVNDPPTAQSMRQALISLPGKTPEAVKDEIAKVLLNRTPASQKKDWATLWRVPVDKAIAESQLPFDEVIKQIIEGLAVNSQNAIKPLVKLTMFTSNNCPPCEEWVIKELPKVPVPEWEVVKLVDPTKQTPSFHICFNEQCRDFVGYTSFETLNAVLASMNKAID